MDVAHLPDSSHPAGLDVAGLQSPSGALISLYLRSGDGPASTVLADVNKHLKSRSESLARPAEMSVRADLERLAGLAGRVESERRPGWAIFSSSADDIFEVHGLSEEVPTSVTVGRLPYLRPLRALPVPLSMLVAVIERPRVEVLRQSEAALESLGAFEAETGKDNYGGFRGYEEAKVRGRAGEESKAIWKEAGARALAAHQQQPFDGLLLAGHRHDLDGFAELLHTYLRSLPAERATVDPSTVTPSELAELAAAAASKIRRRRDEEAIRAVLDGAYAGTPIAKGSSAVLRAANVGAVERLVLCGPFSRPGVRCPDCGWLARSGESCPACGTELEALDDVLGAAMERVLQHGGRADQVRVASALDADGTAAVLRFPVG